jgi:hypothetical protein
MKSVFVENSNSQTTEADLAVLLQLFGQVGALMLSRIGKQAVRGFVRTALVNVRLSIKVE